MKAKHALLIFILGFCFDFVASLLKIMHAPNSNTLFMIGTVLKITGALIFVYKLVTYPKWKDFLNR